MKEKNMKLILEWIEENISSGISVEDVVAISGYSRRYIHDIFKESLSMSPGQYIRKRRLSKAAVRLRLTNQSATNIAHQLSFSSQQSFTKEFKKEFGYTPREYRKMELWDLDRLRIPRLISYKKDISIRLTELPGLTVIGYEVEYSEIISDRPIDSNPFRQEAIVKNLSYYEDDIFLLSNFEPKEKNSNQLDITTFIGINEKSTKNSRFVSRRCVDSGLYAEVNFVGSWKEYSTLSRYIYMDVLPSYKLKRRRGYDIEHFKYHSAIQEDVLQEGAEVDVSYFIPVCY
ncbi:TPA: helix-turn-helix domain-containing protein [Escherichia coli]|uniref:helix-turn-helix domain-containing protein n=1 Tax=Escherichia coli TaxID=562 RepID=UPI001666CFE8|nr:helix-turn-helix domain-containing protein [Escherichia coli]EMC8921880.1 helix-turn-helix domain-containing protein [Shigella sonnei]EER9344705.1 helix-turn-helix domain-containing protein [Escherichia coli]EES5635168.1 helix-turn-helix domain-containing protein [Escherichia coli]EET0039530.1 helix-turn-helix domain-containing protein [Escherichia coli]EET3386641.1 helix-turn-helix domain-containing protein [Escherichia coli]